MKRISVIFAVFLCGIAKDSSGNDRVSGIHKDKDYSAFDSASWAITSNRLSPRLGSDKQSLYDSYMDACDAAISESNKQKDWCRINDRVRMRMNRDQPSSVYNYTRDGYAKTRVPAGLYSEIKEFFDENRHEAKIEWKEYNVYHNAWESPPTFINLHDSEEYDDDISLTAKIEEEVKPILEKWTGQRLSPVSTYGIRLYHNGSILAPHVDRMPLVTSVIIQVDQDVDEPWPLEVYGHDGTATNVTMEPGDMVLYESHSVIHGRPFPMLGKYFANCFIHFEPYEPIEGESSYDPELDLPPYLKSGSLWAKDWINSNPRGWKGTLVDVKLLAAQGKVEEFKEKIRKNPAEVHQKDMNGWTVLHEATRSGQVEIVKLILGYGADKDLLTYTGVTPFNIARQYLGEDHEMVKYFESIDAKDISPSLRHREL